MSALDDVIATCRDKFYQPTAEVQAAAIEELAKLRHDIVSLTESSDGYKTEAEVLFNRACNAEYALKSEHGQCMAKDKRIAELEKALRNIQDNAAHALSHGIEPLGSTMWQIEADARAVLTAQQKREADVLPCGHSDGIVFGENSWTCAICGEPAHRLR